MTGSPTDEFAWVRTEVAGRPVDTTDNAADFQLVSPSPTVGGLTAELGSASPTGASSPFQHNATLRSTLLDPTAASAHTPNRDYTSGARPLDHSPDHHQYDRRHG